jgi:hypothetical protein
MAAVDDAKHTPEVLPRGGWRRRLVWCVLTLLILGVLIAVMRWRIANYSMQSELSVIIVELDKTDPRWRIEDIEADRKIIPDPENTALVILQIDAALRANPRPEPLQLDMQIDRANDTPPDVQIDPQIQAELRKELQRVAPQVKQALSLALMKDGRFPLSISNDYIGTRTTCDGTRSVFGLLQQDLALRLRDRDVAEACLALRAMVVATRSIGDEPMAFSQLIRIAGRGMAARGLERILAQGRPTEATLAALQQVLEEEEAVPILVYAMRGARAGQHVLMNALEDGSVTSAQLSGNPSNHGSFGGLDDTFSRLTSGSALRRAHVVSLRYLNQYLDASRLPPEQFADGLTNPAQLLKDHDFPELTRVLLGIWMVGESYLRTRTAMRTAIVAVAAERFRLERSRWPKDLIELVPTYLKQVPLDPYDGNPLRLRAVEDGLLIYSIGHDRQDDGGKFDRNMPNAPNSDIVFQLWNVDERRKPAVNPDVGPPRPTEEELQIMANQEWMHQAEPPKAPEKNK